MFVSVWFVDCSPLYKPPRKLTDEVSSRLYLYSSTPSSKLPPIWQTVGVSMIHFGLSAAGRHLYHGHITSSIIRSCVTRFPQWHVPSQLCSYFHSKLEGCTYLTKWVADSWSHRSWSSCLNCPGFSSQSEGDRDQLGHAAGRSKLCRFSSTTTNCCLEVRTINLAEASQPVVLRPLT
jgi:hypothetical protein